MPVNVAALTIFAQSVFGVIIAALGSERRSLGQLLGSITIVTGLVLDSPGRSNGLRTEATQIQVQGSIESKRLRPACIPVSPDAPAQANSLLGGALSIQVLRITKSQLPPAFAPGR